MLRSLEELVEAVCAGDAPTRTTAAAELGALGDRRAVPDLIPLLGDESEVVRRAAIAALWALGEGPLADAVEAALAGHPAPLADLGDRRALGPLARALPHPEWKVRRSAVEALGWLRDRQALGPLIPMLGDAHAKVRQAAAAEIAGLGYASIAQAVEAAFAGQPEPAHRLSDPRLLDAFLLALRTGDAPLRRAAAAALGPLGDPRGLEPLAAALTDTDASVREAAVSALCALARASRYPVVQLLIQCLRSPAADARRGAAATLGALRETQAIRPLIEVLGDGEGGVRAAAVTALAGMGQPAVGPLLEALSQGSEHARAGAARALAHAPGERVTQLLAGALGDGSDVVREAAARSLGLRADRRATGPLLNAVADPNASVRGWAARALGRMGHEGAAAALVRALDDESGFVRAGAAWALGCLRAPWVVSALIARLDDSDAEVRQEAAEALGALEAAASSALPALRRRLAREAATDVRAALEEAIARIEQVMRWAPAELEAASAPAGSGTELEASSWAGSGTELEAAPAPAPGDVREPPRRWWRIWG